MATLKKAHLLVLFLSSHMYGMKAPKIVLKNAQTETIAATLDLNKVDEHGKAPLHYAVLAGNCTEIASLVQRGASLLTKTTDTGATVFHLAAEIHNYAVKKVLLFFALLQQGDAFIQAITNKTSAKPFVLKVLQERAIQLKKLLQVTSKDGQTACAFERRQNPECNAFGGQAPLLSAHKVHTDLQAFVTALEENTLTVLPENNVYKAALSMSRELKSIVNPL